MWRAQVSPMYLGGVDGDNMGGLFATLQGVFCFCMGT